MATTTLARTKLRLGITGTAQDDLLTMLLEQAEAIVARRVSCSLESPPVEATEFYDGNNHHTLPLRRWPVVSVAAVYEDFQGAYGQGDDPFAAATLLEEGTAWALVRETEGEPSRSGLLRRLGGRWCGRTSYPGTLTPVEMDGQGNIAVTYTAGWTTIPADLELVTQRLVVIELAQQLTGRALQSESIEHGDYSYVLAQAAEAKQQAGSTEAILNSYYRPTF